MSLYKIKPRRPTHAELPASADEGELIITSDTHQIYTGEGEGNPLAAVGGGSGAVASVFGRTGTVAAESSDYSSFYDLAGAAAIAQSNAENFAASAVATETSRAESAEGLLVLKTTTVNGHALSGNITVSASDITTGTLPHAQLPILVSGDIPNNAANTSGTAANVSGTPALPNGTTATTQTTGDTSAKIATDAFVEAALPLLKSATFTISTADLILSDQGNPSFTPITLVTPGVSQVAIISSLSFSYTGGSNGWSGGTGQVGYNESGVIYAPSGGTFPPGGDSLLIDGSTPITVFTPTSASSYDGTGGCIGKTLIFVAEDVYAFGPILTATVTSGNAGTGYAPGDTGNINTGDNNAAYTVNTVDGGGGVLTFTLTNGGQGNTVSTGNGTTVTSGGGDGTFEVDINSVGQPNGTATLTLLYYLLNA
jgi:hypothetical protein